MLRRGLLALVLLLAALPSRAETLVEKVHESRTYLYFTLADAAARSVLPAGWEPAPLPQGPAKGANLILVLIDRLLATDAANAPLDPAVNRLLVVVVPGRAGSEAGPVVVGGISARPTGAPGAYGTYAAGKVEFVRSSRDGVVDEDWEAEAPDGDRLTLGLSYAVGVPAFLTFDQKTYSGADPSFFRIYRGDWGVDPVQSGVTGMDRTTRLELSASGPLLGRLLDGSQELVAVSAVPWYRRDTFLP
jgi:hypothetical protein